MTRYRIVALDGTSISGGSGFVQAGLLRELHKRLAAEPQPCALLDQVDLFAGTSAGAFSTLFVALRARPDEALDDLVELWGALMQANRDGFSPGRAVSAFVGRCALLSSKKVQGVLAEAYGPDTRLGDLRHTVVIPTFRLDCQDGPKPGEWGPEIVHNFPRPDNRFLDQRLVDVALRSGSPPVIMPIYQGMDGTGSGYVDGGTYANNPAPIALGEALRFLEHGQAVAPMLGSHAADHKGVLLLSLGNAHSPSCVQPHFCDGRADWGWGEWVTDLNAPLRLIDLMMEAGVEAAHATLCYQLQQQYHRLNPYVQTPMSATSAASTQRAIENLLALDTTQRDVDQTLAWFKQSNWL